MSAPLLVTRALRLNASRLSTRLFHRQSDTRQSPSVTPFLEDTNSELPTNNESIIDNQTRALISKTTWELTRSLGILGACSNRTIVENCLPIMQKTRKICGEKVFRSLLMPTFYRQFVGGETKNEIFKCIEDLRKSNVKALLATPYEECEDSQHGNEHVFHNNCASILQCLEISACLSDKDGSSKMQLKTSGLMSTGILDKIGKLYQQSENKLDLIKSLAQDFESNSVNIEPYKEILTRRELDCFKSGIERHREIARFAESNNVKLLIDAELTNQNPGISVVALGMMAAFNKNLPLIWNTYQCYLKDALQILKEDLNITQQLGVSFGAKLVRGAYMLQENKLAESVNMPSPVCDSQEATNINYNTVVKFLLEHLKQVGPDKTQFIIASHNEESINLVVKLMKELEIKEGVVFGQLYGMCDPITFSLAKNDYDVYKSVPFGPMETVLPYLARRAVENLSVFGGTRKEMELVRSELRHRFFKIPFVKKAIST